jgi:hypothetical protein
MPYVHRGAVVENRSFWDPRRIPEALQAFWEGIVLFVTTIFSPEAARVWLDSKKKKDDDLAGEHPTWVG